MRKPAMDGYGVTWVRPWMKKLGRWGFAGLAGLMLIRLVGGGMLIWHFDNALETMQKGEAYSAPLPHERASLDEKAVANRALRYYRAACELRPTGWKPLDRADLSDVANVPSEKIVALEKPLALWDETIELVRRGARLPYRGEHLSFGDREKVITGWGEFESIPALRHLIRVILLRARLRAEQGRIDEAMADCVAAIRFTDIVMPRHTLIDEMLRQVGIKKGLAVMAGLLRTGKVGREAVEKAFSALSRVRGVELLGRCMISEIDCTLEIFRLLQGKKIGMDAFGWDTSVRVASSLVLSWLARPWLLFERSEALRVQGILLAAVRRSRWARGDLERFRTLRPEASAFSVLGAQVIPNLGRAVERSFDLTARLRAMQGTLALRLTGTLPANQAGDPYTEDLRPLATMTDEGGAWAYSVGPDGKDQGGVGDDLR